MRDLTKLLPVDMTEDEAQTLSIHLRSKYKWEGTLFGREDINDHCNRDITDSEWDRVCQTYEWRKGLAEQTTSNGWDIVEMAISAAGLEICEDEDDDEGKEQDDDD